jgi:hypothetical protein
VKTTPETSGEDVKTTLEASGEDVKTTLETSGEDTKLHSKRVEKTLPFAPATAFTLTSVIVTLTGNLGLNYTRNGWSRCESYTRNEWRRCENYTRNEWRRCENYTQNEWRRCENYLFDFVNGNWRLITTVLCIELLF